MDRAELFERIGLARCERGVVIHADDIGMCEATAASYRRLAAASAMSSASTMTVCGWYPAIARICQQSPVTLDMGVHLALSSEWSDYRWGPVLGAAAESLCDDSGYFPMTTAAARRVILQRVGSDFSMLQAELSAQIERALRHGLDVTHVDSHMYVLYHSALLPTYARVALQYSVPACAPPWAKDVVTRMDAAERAAVVTFDGWFMLPLDDGADRWNCIERMIQELPPGLSYVICHPAQDSGELRALAADWQARVADDRLLTDARWARALDAAGVKVFGMRAIRDAIFPDR
jgi:predicted glycoside hydrolase/deacetylase ChbG (UPF0249 family)